MARRSSTNRWSRPATGKQIAALKAGGKYDGKYYSMGRASQSIEGTGRAGAWSASRGSTGGRSSASVYSPLALSASGPAGLPVRVAFGSADLDSLLAYALGASPQSRLASSGGGPASILSELLGVPDDLDSLVQAALRSELPDQTISSSDGEAVESVSFTVRSDDSDPAQPRIVVEADVVRNSSFKGKPSVQIRVVATDEPGADRVSGVRGRSGLAYRPAWTPVLVRTPAELADQMRVHWVPAVEELKAGVDPRLSTFLTSAGGMEAALAVIDSGQSPASKYIHLQGILDPAGPIQFQGIGLNATTVAEQIRKAHEGDAYALDWLSSVQYEQILTSFAEVSGMSLAAEADFRLERWRKQANDFVSAVTMNADEFGIDFTLVRQVLAMQAEAQARREESRVRLQAISDDEVELPQLLDELDAICASSSSEYGLPEDWFFEEGRLYLHAKFRQSLPAQFAAALTPPEEGRPTYDALVDEVRTLANTSSVDPADYAPAGVPNSGTRTGVFATPYGGRSQGALGVHRLERIAQAVRRANADFAGAGDDDLGTLIMAREVLAYAQWKRDELRGAQQIAELARRRVASDQRAKDAAERADRAEMRRRNASDVADTISRLDQIVHDHVDALERSTTSITITDPLPMEVQEAADAWLAEAEARETAAAERLAAAEERERWVESETSIVATPHVGERMAAERDAANTEKAAAFEEQDAARQDHRDANDHRRMVQEARTRFEEQIQPVRLDNEKRLQSEAEIWRETLARREQERRQHAEEQRQKWEAEQKQRIAANRRQEEANQRQQDRARAAKNLLASELAAFLALPATTSFWRRKSLETSRASLEQRILELQEEIVAPLEPPRTSSKAWPSLLARGDRFLGTVRKVTDYGVFISLPAGADGLLRGSDIALGQRLVIEIADMPRGKPIVLTRAPMDPR